MATQTPERLAYTPHEAAFALNLGESKLRELYRTGRLSHVVVGRRILIPVAAVQRFLNGEQTGSANDRAR